MAEKEYIEREAAIKIASGYCHPSNVANELAKLPAADVREVVRAVWQYKTMTVPGGRGQTYAKWRCSACKGKAKERTNFCPNCGAMMEES